MTSDTANPAVCACGGGDPQLGAKQIRLQIVEQYGTAGQDRCNPQPLLQFPYVDRA
jgi:hypothetical protein